MLINSLNKIKLEIMSILVNIMEKVLFLELKIKQNGPMNKVLLLIIIVLKIVLI